MRWRVPITCSLVNRLCFAYATFGSTILSSAIASSASSILPGSSGSWRDAAEEDKGRHVGERKGVNSGGGDGCSELSSRCPADTLRISSTERTELRKITWDTSISLAALSSFSRAIDCSLIKGSRGPIYRERFFRSRPRPRGIRSRWKVRNARERDRFWPLFLPRSGYGESESPGPGLFVIATGCRRAFTSLRVVARRGSLRFIVNRCGSSCSTTLFGIELAPRRIMRIFGY